MVNRGSLGSGVQRVVPYRAGPEAFWSDFLGDGARLTSSAPVRRAQSCRPQTYETVAVVVLMADSTPLARCRYFTSWTSAVEPMGGSPRRY